MHRFKLTASAIALILISGTTSAKVSPEDAAKLGAELTPVGAEKAGNADGSIAPWTPAPKSGDIKGQYPSDPKIDAEKPLFTVTKANMAQYKNQLSEGHKYLLETYATYKMNVYPSHRTIAFPDFINKATIENAKTCELIGVDNPQNCTIGFTFPIPKTGAEVMWNHKVRYRGDGVRRYNNQMIVQPDGSFQLTKIVEDVNFYYATEKEPEPLTPTTGTFLKYLSKTIAPPRMAGTMILVHEKAGAGAGGRQAWLYSPGLKRVRRAPTVCCDNPYEGTDGHQFYDQVDMFNGVLERYDWKLIGKKEMLIPYNSNKIGGPTIKYADLATPKHLNQDLPRYEKHRVWVVEATIRQGTNHTFHKRRYYVDEDSWYPAMADLYDSRGGLFQFQEGHLAYASNVQSAGGLPEVIYHITSGRYFITALANEDKPNDYSQRFDNAYFESASVQKNATK